MVEQMANHGVSQVESIALAGNRKTEHPVYFSYSFDGCEAGHK